MSGGMFDLSGQLAVVTGARRGIGLAIAEACAAAGADIVAVSASLDPRDSEVARRVRAQGRTCISLRADLSEPGQVHRLAEELVALDRPIDVLVNNAGTIVRAPAVEHTDEEWATVLQVDLTSQFVLTREIGRSMIERRRGKVIFMASLLTFQGGLNVVSYAAAKSGLAGMTRALANEWAGSGINVNAIAPGYISTDNTQALREDPGRNRAITDRIPAGRWGSASDIAGAAVFLATSASDYVNGAILPVDGGWLGR